MSDLERKLLDAGYKEYSVPIIWQCDKFFQKSIKLDGVKVYYINVKYYDWTKYTQVTHRKESIEFDIQFRLPDGDTFNLQYGTEDISKAEELIDKMYRNMDCAPYGD